MTAKDLEEPVGRSIAEAAPAALAGKAEQPAAKMLTLAILAGAFIAFGSMASLVAQANVPSAGPVQILSGIAFSVGLAMVMIVGAELFTGNTMMALPAARGDLPLRRMLSAWTIVWIGNLVGSIAVAVLFAAAGGLEDGVGEAAASTADAKLAKSPAAVFCSGILANILVCLAVWMSMSAATLPAKILAILGPITVFVAAGLEHSIANMSLLPLGWLAPGAGPPDLVGGLSNLVFSTLGNIVGGAGLALAVAFGHDALRRDG